MSEQSLDLKRSVNIVRRHLVAVLIVAVLGLAGGGAYAFVHPLKYSSSALVVLPARASVPTQAVIASSTTVLAGALQFVHTPTTLAELRSSVVVQNQASVLTITAQGSTADQAESLANAVARSYVDYVTGNASPAAHVQAKLLVPASSASQGSLVIHWLLTAGLGILLGAAIGAVGVIAINRGDRRLRNRNDVASAIGIPVIASLSVLHPTDAGKWTQLLDNYEPTAVHQWQFLKALRYLGLEVPSFAGSADRGGQSLTVLSLSSDKRALALGPQLAVFSASQGADTALVIGHQQDVTASAALRAACAAWMPSRRQLGHLLVAVADHGKLDEQPDAALTVVVAVVDAETPQVSELIHTNVTVVGVSAGAATAEQLARVAAAAGADGRQIDGILLADPNPEDRTTGIAPRLGRPGKAGQPTRLTGVPVREQAGSSRRRHRTTRT